VGAPHRELAFKDLDFEANVELDLRPVLRLRGNAVGPSVPQFAGLVLDLHHELVERYALAVMIDIRALEVMSSVCFNVFVNWLGVIQEMPVDDRYRLRFKSNRTIPWQGRSLRALACFATDLVIFEG
jgi:hypothetical protein